MRVGQLPLNNFWTPHRDSMCGRCHAPYEPRGPHQKYCENCRHPTKILLTLEQSLIIVRFKKLCAKCKIPIAKTFAEICGTDERHFYHLTKVDNRKEISAQRIRLWCKAVEDFCNELEDGYYDLRPVRCVAVRRKAPTGKNCPMNAALCKGGALPDSCPRHWRECPLHAA